MGVPVSSGTADVLPPFTPRSAGGGEVSYRVWGGVDIINVLILAMTTTTCYIWSTAFFEARYGGASRARGWKGWASTPEGQQQPCTPLWRWASLAVASLWILATEPACSRRVHGSASLLLM